MKVSDAATVPRYRLERLGVVMAPSPGAPVEEWGVCNPGCARGPDGELYLFPRLVARGNLSRIGRVRVRFDGDGNPVGVERLGLALQPEEAWERNAHTGGGTEDARVTYVPTLGRYVMTYTGYGPLGPRVGIAVSRDLDRWERLGPVLFARSGAWGTDLGLFPNKDGVLFPEPVPGPDGEPSYALLHRPQWDLSGIREVEGSYPPTGIADGRPGIWVSYAPAERVGRDLGALQVFETHRPVAGPVRDWEARKIGAGTPPIRTAQGWLLLYHGVSGRLDPTELRQRHVTYRAGAMLLDEQDLSRVRWRTAEPLLEPATPEELDGVVPNVVFPTAVDPLPDGRAHVYYGMADTRIGVALLTESRPVPGVTPS